MVTDASSDEKLISGFTEISATARRRTIKAAAGLGERALSSRGVMLGSFQFPFPLRISAHAQSDLSR